MDARHREVQARRQVDNAALVQARIQAQSRSYAIKIDRVQRILARDTLDPVARRMNTGRLSKLEERSAAMVARLESRTGLSVSVSPVAAVIVSET